MTGPRVDPAPLSTRPMTGAEWAASQSAPLAAMQSGDPMKATTSGLGRPLTGAEWSQSQRMSAEQVKSWKIPALPMPTIQRDVTKTPADPKTKGKQISGLAGVLTRNLVDPILDHPIMSAPMLAVSVPGVAAAAPALAMAAAAFGAGTAATTIGLYGWQKAAASSLSPEAKAEFERDPDHVSGEAAAVQAALLGLIPAGIAAGRAIGRTADVGVGMMEDGAKGAANEIRATTPDFSQAADADARGRFAARLVSGSSAAIAPNDIKRPRGFEVTSPVVRAREIPRVQGLEVPEDVTAGRVKKLATESPFQSSLEDLRVVDAGRVQQETKFTTPEGAQELGAAAAEAGLPADANPYHPDSLLEPAWRTAHDAVTQPEVATTAPTVANAVEPIEGTGPTRTRGLAQGVQDKALANHLDLTVGDLPEYRQVSMADQASRAADLIGSDPDLARRVATGQAAAPHGLLPESVFVAVEQKAIAEGDVATLRDLATGKLTSEATTMGQRIRALGERDPDSPVKAIQDVITKRSGGDVAKVAKASDAELATIRAAIDGTPIEPTAWSAFVDSLKC